MWRENNQAFTFFFLDRLYFRVTQKFFKGEFELINVEEITELENPCFVIPTEVNFSNYYSEC